MIYIKSINLALAVIYRPPQTSEEDNKFTEMLAEIEIALNNMGNPSPNIILCGDFNFPFLKFNKSGKNTNIRWKPTSSEDGRQADSLFTLTNKFLLMQEITENTR
jgi:hypothetical protein